MEILIILVVGGWLLVLDDGCRILKSTHLIDSEESRRCSMGPCLCVGDTSEDGKDGA